MTSPTFEEWFDVVRATPANKAPGPSGISYDLLKHLGPIALAILHKLTCSYFSLNTIPVGWKRAAIYLSLNLLHGTTTLTIHVQLRFWKRLEKLWSKF